MNSITKQAHEQIFALQSKGKWAEAEAAWLELGEKTRAEVARFIGDIERGIHEVANYLGKLSERKTKTRKRE